MKHKGFNGDRWLWANVIRLTADHDIKRIIETGTLEGHTARMLSEISDEIEVITIDTNPCQNLQCQNLRQIVGDSPTVLKAVLPQKNVNTLFYLDAHWGGVQTAVRGELEAIAAWHATCPSVHVVIVIHDFYVPDKDFGYDVYAGKRLDWEYISDLVPGVFPSGYQKTYSQKVEYQRIGSIMLESL